MEPKLGHPTKVAPYAAYFALLVEGLEEEAAQNLTRLMTRYPGSFTGYGFASAVERISRFAAETE